jgi:hypothetical protein
VKVKSPRHRYEVTDQAVKQRLETPAQPRMAALYMLLAGQPCPDSAVEYAHDIYAVVRHRETLDAFLLARTPIEKIVSCLEINFEVITTYADLFMDMQVFRNRLELMTYVQDYDGTDEGKELASAGVRVGHDYLLWALGSSQEVDPRVVVRRTMADAYFRGMAHKGNSLTSLVAKEALRWSTTAIRNAQVIEQLDPRGSKEGFEELRLTLVGVDETRPALSSPVPVGEILH